MCMNLITENDIRPLVLGNVFPLPLVSAEVASKLQFRESDALLSFREHGGNQSSQ